MVNKKYRVGYLRYDGYYGCVESSGKTPKQAETRAVDYLEANGILYQKIDEVYEIDELGKRC